jgi:hypothetical protein
MCTDEEGEIGREGETLRDGETERRKISGSGTGARGLLCDENFGSVTSDLRCVLIVGVFDYFGYETRFIMGVSDFLLI